jgi:N-acetylneuraminic acid mutarotase
VKNIFALAAVLAFGLTGCLETTAADGVLKCATGHSELCPDGYYCAANNTCFHNGHTGPAQGTCSDGIKNGSETDKDCGGSCSPCAVGSACDVPADCVTALCKMSVCTTPPQQCLNGVQDPGETDKDCGGPVCPTCAVGQTCTVNADCTGMMCDPTSDLCIDQCADGVRNGDESDVDCGGSCREKCHANQTCGISADCGSDICTNGYCIPVPLPAWIKLLDYSSSGRFFTGTCGALGADGLIYMFGGWDIEGMVASFSPNFLSYDPATNTLAFVPVSAQAPAPNGVAGCSMVAGSNGKLYVLGGLNSTWLDGSTSPKAAPVQVYDSTNKLWDVTTYPAVPASSGYVFAEGAAVNVGTTIFTLGGYFQGDGNYGSAITDAFDVAGKAWNTSTPAVSTESRRWQGAAVGTNGLIYVFGGVVSALPMNQLVSYDPVANAWSPDPTVGGLKSMPTARYQVAGATGADGLVYAVGGSATTLTSLQKGALAPVAPGAVGTVEAYSPKADAWITVPGLNTPGASVVTATANDGRIYAIGGANGETDTPTNYRDVVEAYGPVVTLANAAGAVGTKRQVTGSNFAPNATVNVYFGASATVVGTGATDGTGAVTGPIVFTVPSVAPGAYQLKVVDTRSDYPYYLIFTVQ